MEEEGERGPDEGYLLVRVHVPELNVQKCLQFPRDQLVWDVKQQCLAALPKVSILTIIHALVLSTMEFINSSSRRPRKAVVFGGVVLVLELLLLPLAIYENFYQKEIS